MRATARRECRLNNYIVIIILYNRYMLLNKLNVISAIIIYTEPKDY